MADKAARVFKGVDPQSAPFVVVAHFAGGVAVRAHDEVGMAGAAGVHACRLVAQIERPATVVGVVGGGSMRRETTHEHDVAFLAGGDDGFDVGHQLGADGRAAFALVVQIARLHQAGQDFHTAHFLCGIADGQPTSDDIRSFGLGHHDAGVLVPGCVVERRTGIALVRQRRFGAQMLDGIAGQLGAEQRFY